MPSIKQVGGKTQLEIERFDGGLNKRDSPSRIGIYESPDCLNVVFDEQGSVQTRKGCIQYSTNPIGTSDVIVNMANYNETMIAWAAGTMYRASGTAMVAVTGSTSQFATGTVVAYAIYNNNLICSDGTNGPWRYTGYDAACTGTTQSFYYLGIPIPSAPTAVTNTPTSFGKGLTSGTYYYRCAYVNTSIIEGQMGSWSTGTVIATAATCQMVYLTGIPVPTTTQAVYTKYLYRASTVCGTYRRIGSVPTGTSIFTDVMDALTWSVQNVGVIDGTAPTPFQTVVSHKERLFFPDNSNKTLLRYTEYGNPHISLAENYIPLNKGDYRNIISVAVQDDLLTAIKDNQMWCINMPSAGDDTTWDYIKLPGNIGIVGPNAKCEIPNGLLFLGKIDGRPSGFHILSGLSVMSTADDKMRTQSISERIEPDILTMPTAMWDDTYLYSYNNRVYASVALANDTYNQHIYWFDLNRLGDKGQPGSWSLWDGRAAEVRCFTVVGGNLYAGSSRSDGRIMQLEYNAYSDNGDGINSYWWSKQFGGEPAVESWIKDWRKVNIWYYLMGDWEMNVRYRAAGANTYASIPVSLSPGTGTWPITFGVTVWTGDIGDEEVQYGVGNIVSRRFQIGFDNQWSSSVTNANVGQAFKVHSCKMLMNLRRQRD